MALDASLAYLHLLAILSWVVFLSSTAALARMAWLNGAVVERLRVVDRIAMVAGWLTLASGLARWWLGLKGAGWYAGQPLLWAKLALMACMLVAGWQTTRQIGGWHAAWVGGQRLPDEAEVVALRRRVMRASHLMLVLPLLGVLLARGIGVR